jgi:archaellum component FlaC
VGAGGGIGGGDEDCCIVNELKIDDLRDRISRFKEEMEDDIALMFDRIDDRIFDFRDRLTRLTSRFDLIITENNEVSTEIEDINRDVIILEEELGDQTSIQNDVVLDLSE